MPWGATGFAKYGSLEATQQKSRGPDAPSWRAAPTWPGEGKQTSFAQTYRIPRVILLSIVGYLTGTYGPLNARTANSE